MNISRVLLLLTLTTFSLLKEGMLEIVITNGPQDITVHEGATAMFPCLVSGTTDLPVWYIGGSVYTIRGLPPRHFYSNRTLTVSDVQLSDNGKEYRCSFLVVSSSTGVLTVSAASKGENNTQKVTTELLSSTFPELPANNLTGVTAAEIMVTATTILWSESYSNLKLLAPVLSSVFTVICVIVIISSIFILLVGRRIRKARNARIKLELANRTNADTAVYEEVADTILEPKSGFKVNINSCYSLEPDLQDPVYAEVEDVIKMKRNDVYGLTQENNLITANIKSNN